MAEAAFARPIGNIVDDAAEALYMTLQVTGNFEKAIIPLVTAGQFKAAMEKAQQAKTGYTSPTAIE